jgi:hypothetical protein
MKDESTVVPRRKPMIVRQLGDELLVYDKRSKKAYCLNRVAGEVWMLCDGSRTVGEIVRHFGTKSESVIDGNIVPLTLQKLQRSGLLESGSSGAKQIELPSRRSLLKKLGAASALAIPIVTSILVPTPAEAASPCRTALQPCPQGNAQCCTHLCIAGLCS